MVRLLLPLVALLTAVPGHAEDGCLLGTSSLSDQRALAALVEAAGATCPCAAAPSRRRLLALPMTAASSAMKRGCSLAFPR